MSEALYSVQPTATRLSCANRTSRSTHIPVEMEAKHARRLFTGLAFPTPATNVVRQMHDRKVLHLCNLKIP